MESAGWQARNLPGLYPEYSVTNVRQFSRCQQSACWRCLEFEKWQVELDMSQIGLGEYH